MFRVEPAAEVFPPDWPRTKSGRPQRPPPAWPATAGVYVIRLGMKTYSGGSTRLLARVDDHLRQLALGRHEDKGLQAAFAAAAGRVTLTIRPMPGATDDDLCVAELEVIRHLLRRGFDPINRKIRPRPADYKPGRHHAHAPWREASEPRRGEPAPNGGAA